MLWGKNLIFHVIRFAAMICMFWTIVPQQGYHHFSYKNQYKTNIVICNIYTEKGKSLTEVSTSAIQVKCILVMLLKRSARAEILEFYPTRPEHIVCATRPDPNPNIICAARPEPEYHLCYPTRTRVLLVLPDRTRTWILSVLPDNRAREDL
jgi:hypothetical protein